MSSFCILLRCSYHQKYAVAPLQIIRISQYRFKHSDKSYNKNDEQTPKLSKNNEAIEKLNLLLKSMVQDDSVSSTSHASVELSKPKPKFNKKPPLKEQSDGVNDVKKETFGQTLEKAAKGAAAALDGDPKQIESELLHKLLSHSVDVSEMQLGKPAVNLSDLIVGMKIDRTKRVEGNEEEKRVQQVRRIVDNRHITGDKPSAATVRSQVGGEEGRRLVMGKVNLFAAEPLGIFTKLSTRDVSVTAELPTWQRLQDREMYLAVTQPPANIYEEVILWTNQGKLWKFPINNEQGLEEELKVSFTEHVFLTQHLEPWCPKLGPIRHFMELVCVGLSKNPYLTVYEKHEHISWFKNYFESKQNILKEVGAIIDNGQAQITP